MKKQAESAEQVEQSETLNNGVVAIGRYREARQELQQARVRAERYLAVANVMMLVLDADGAVKLCNDRGARVLNWESEKLAGRDWFETCVPRFVRMHVRGLFLQLICDPEGSGEWGEIPVVTQDEQLRYISWKHSVLRNEAGAVESVILSGEDITHRRESEQKLRMLEKAVEQSPAMVVLTDATGAIEYVNSEFVRNTGYSLNEVKGRNPRVLKSGYTTQAQYEQLWETITAGRDWRGLFHNTRKDGTHFWAQAWISPVRDIDGTTTHYLAIHEDVTRKQSLDQEIDRRSQQDPTTGLPNRALLFDRLDRALRSANDREHAVALLFVDLNDFNKVNESLGHLTGDRILKQAANRLLAGVGHSNSVARISGDLFAVVLEKVEQPITTKEFASAILRILARPFAIDGHQVHLTANIGLTVAPDDGNSAADLLRNAENALHRAKEAGANRFRFFEPSMNLSAMAHLQMEAQLRQALEAREFSVHYQPVVSTTSGRIVGVEALLRWSNALLGDVPPDVFIPIAEHSGLIGIIGAWVLETACREAAGWRCGAGVPLRIAVNISSCQVNSELVQTVARTLEITNCPAERLELEVTEGVLLSDAPETTETLETLSRLGVRLAIDDFGTGYSALGYLKRFPFSCLKIDRSFTNNVVSDGHDAALASAIIAMAHALGLEVVGEGVETPQQLDFLKSRSCDKAQGYYFSRPIPAPEFERFLQQRC